MNSVELSHSTRTRGSFFGEVSWVNDPLIPTCAPIAVGTTRVTMFEHTSHVDAFVDMIRRSPSGPVVVLSGDKLTTLAVRQLERCGHEVPHTVAEALRGLLSDGEPTAREAHRLAQRLATAASRTLADADLRALTMSTRAALPLGEGLASVG